ncbi:hypothetical protein [Nocardioides sp. SLBN-35]|uniref:hypothetical protein n=1 Tax=Nocardioides sp. SLBN-35 TaxID=2768445 RepID=UPI001153C741|nr:hypothetical protein [Nocardioides sp. SLBN-35]TQK73364.1 hypothetical protein FBY23_5196 [Nocardioides sp. SLBN-35]
MNHLDEEPIATAIKAAIQTELDDKATAYDVDEVPGTVGGNAPSSTPPDQHVEIEFARVDAEPSRRASGDVSIPDRELTTRYHAGSSTSVRELRRRTGIALEGRAYDLPDGDTVGPFRFVLGEPVQPDDTGWVAADHWVFA